MLYVTKWTRNLDLDLTSEDWLETWQATHKVSQNVAALKTSYKVLSRWYLVPYQIAKYASCYSSICFRGCGTYLHTWWTCALVRSFWVHISSIISHLFETPIQPDPKIVLLNVAPSELTRNQSCLLFYVMTAAKQTIARSCKSSAVCTVTTKSKVPQVMIHAKIEATPQGKVRQYTKIWQPWIDKYLPPDFDASLLDP